MRNYNSRNQGAAGSPANVPMRHYSQDDVIELVRPSRPASMRPAIPGINCPGEGEDWQELNAWRARYGLDPVTR